MITTISNPAFLFLTGLLVAFCLRFRRAGERDNAAWVYSVWQRCAASNLLLFVMLAGSLSHLTARIYLGYISPGDYVQEVIAVQEFAAGHSLNPHNMPAAVTAWMTREPLALPGGSAWPALVELQRHSVASELVVQAHPPYHTLLLYPLVIVSRSAQTAFLLITVLHLAALAVALVLLKKHLGVRLSRRDLLLAAALVLCWQPVLANIRGGQVGLLVAALIIGGWYCVMRSKSLAGGFLIGLATLIKMFPALLLVWLLMRQRRAFVSAVLTTGLATLIVYGVAGESAFRDYLAAAKKVEQSFGHAPQNVALPAVLSNIITNPENRPSLSWVITLSCVAVATLSLALFVFWRAVARCNTHPELEFAGFAAAACLLSPTSWSFYYPVLLLPLACIAVVIAKRPVVLRNWIMLLAVTCCFSVPDQLLTTATSVLTSLLGTHLGVALGAFPTIAMAATCVWTTRLLRPEPQPVADLVAAAATA